MHPDIFISTEQMYNNKNDVKNTSLFRPSYEVAIFYDENYYALAGKYLTVQLAMLIHYI